MELYKYLIRKCKVEIGVEYELTNEVKEKLYKKTGLDEEKLARILTTKSNLFKYENKILTLLNQDKTDKQKDKKEEMLYTEDSFEIINNYLGLKVIMMKSNRYINITKLCTKSGQYENIIKSKKYKKFCKLLKEEGITNPSIDVNDILNEYKGTYVHERLAIAIISWISIDFLFKFTTVIEKHIKNKKENPDDSVHIYSDEFIKIKNDHETMANHEKLMTDFEEIRLINKKIFNKIDTMSNILDDMESTINQF